MKFTNLSVHNWDLIVLLSVFKYIAIDVILLILGSVPLFCYLTLLTSELCFILVLSLYSSSYTDLIFCEFELDVIST
jgi:hypothetical protein